MEAIKKEYWEKVKDLEPLTIPRYDIAHKKAVIK